MKLRTMDFQYFRSFGKQQSSIDFDDQMTIFVGKNHTGKSNVMKFLEEIKLHDLPFNQAYKLHKSNWYNNESGIERPLKFRFEVELNDVEFHAFLNTWILNPIYDYFEKQLGGENSSKLTKNHLCSSQWADSIGRHLKERSAVYRMQFIHLETGEQKINYSIQFNNLIAIKTAEGREFVQVVLPEEKRHLYRPHESKMWADYLGESFLRSRKSIKLGDQEPSIKNLLDNNEEDFDLLIKNLIQDVKLETQQFKIAAEDYLDPFYSAFLDGVLIVRGRNATIQEIIKNPDTPIENILAALLIEASNKSIRNKALRRKMHELHHFFESIYESLDIAYTIDISEGAPRVKYVKRQTNRPIQNFDSIGTGISDMLYFLYRIIIGTNNIVFIDGPEENLHPHNQRFLYNLIRDYSEQNQVVIATNSPYFIQPDDVFRLRLFDLERDKTIVRKLEIPSKSRDYIRLKRNFTIRNRDAIFADGLVFVEGPTEEWAFPTFFKNFGLDLDLNNLSLINLHGKGAFAAYWKFAHQLKKEFWFFFDYDVLGVKAGEKITPTTFKRSVIFKKRRLISPEIATLCESAILEENNIEFHEKLEYIRRLLEKYHVFVFTTDFEDMFESYLEGRLQLRGSKVDRAIQLVDFIKEHEKEQMLPERLYRYIEIIQEDLKKI